ncbi:hypothetical protein [Haloplanus vescus]|uniref:hypothetical protein n=1 Tax=Haloplanus vescus TaxID=555874 RepID=UPI00115F982E|nr:hypothetical protein [Haloplanus vescus]
MEDSLWAIAKILLRDAIPMESLTKSWNSLSEKDWIIFFRMIGQVGFIIQTGCASVIAVVFVLRNVVTAPNLLSGLIRLISQSIILAAVILVATWLISQPIDELTGEKAPRTELGSFSAFKLYTSGLLWVALSLFWRYSIFQLEIPLVKDNFAQTVGYLIGIVISDGLYFGGLMVGLGIISQVYLIQSRN